MKIDVFTDLPLNVIRTTYLLGMAIIQVDISTCLDTNNNNLMYYSRYDRTRTR